MIQTKNKTNLLILSFCFAVAAIFIYGYQFNNGDQEEHLPYVYRLLDPSLYAKDYLVPLQTSQFTVRFYFAWLVAGLGKIIPVEMAVFILHFLSLILINFSLSAMVFRRTASEWSMLITPLLILILNNTPLGGNGLFDVQLTCSMPAIALGLAGLNYFDAGKLKTGFALAGLAACFQALIGLHIGLLLFLTSLTLSGRNRIKEALTGFFLFIIFSSPMLVPVLIRQFSGGESYNSSEYFNILFLFRNAHHYAPQCFPAAKFVFMTGYLALIWLLLKKQASEQNRYIKVILFWVITGCIIYSAGFIFLRSETIAKTQWFKANVWLFYLSIVITAGAFGNVLKNAKAFGIIRNAAIVCSIGALILIFNSSILPVEKLQHRYKVGNYPKTDLQLMHDWIRTHVPINALMISFPGDDSFLCEAQRSTLVGFKAIIHEPEFILPWYEKIQRYYGISYLDFDCGVNLIELANERYLNSTFLDLPKNQQPDYFLIKSIHERTKIFESGVQVKQIGDYILFRIK